MVQRRERERGRGPLSSLFQSPIDNPVHVPSVNSQPTRPAGTSYQNPIGIVDGHRYAYTTPRIARLEIATYAPFLALQQTQSRRNFLYLTYIRGLTSTPGLFPTVLFGFGRAPDLDEPFRFNVGQSIAFDVVVPQEDLWFAWDVADPAAAGYQYSHLSIRFSDMPMDMHTS